jgi:hypothetical protein
MMIPLLQKRSLRLLHLLGQQPHHENVRAEDDHEAAVITPLLANMTSPELLDHVSALSFR